MSSDIWNPWHGCRKYSEGCDHCYMHYLDNERGKSGGEIYKVKTNSDLSTYYHILMLASKLLNGVHPNPKLTIHNQKLTKH